MFNTLNKLVNCFKNHYLRILIVPIFLLQVSQSSGQCFKLGSASEIVSHILDLGVQERQFNTVGCYSRRICGERGRSMRSQRYFSAPLVQKAKEIAFSGFSGYYIGAFPCFSVSPLREFVLQEGANASANNTSNKARDADFKEFAHNLIAALIAGTIAGFLSLWLSAWLARHRLDSKPVIPSSGDQKQ